METETKQQYQSQSQQQQLPMIMMSMMMIGSVPTTTTTTTTTDGTTMLLRNHSRTRQRRRQTKSTVCPTTMMMMMIIMMMMMTLLMGGSTTTTFLTFAAAQEAEVMEYPCPMEIYVYNDLTTCTQNPNAVIATALLTADGQCRSVIASSSVTPDINYDAYSLLPGNYRATCVNSTAVQFIESGCINDQCNATSLLSTATCDRNNSMVASLYSRVTIPEFITYPSRDQSYVCFEANGSNVTVSFAIFGDCSSSTCSAPTIPATPAPIVVPVFVPTAVPVQLPVTTPTTTTPQPVLVSGPPVTPPPVSITVPTAPSTISNAPTRFPNDNPTLRPDDDRTSPTLFPTPLVPAAIAPEPSATVVPVPPVNGMTPSTMDMTRRPTVLGDANSNNNTSSSSSSNNRSTLIAGVASGVAFVAVLLAGLLLYRNRKQHHHRDDDQYHDDYNKNIMVDSDGFGGNGGGGGGQSHNSSTDHNQHPQQNNRATNGPAGLGGSGSHNNNPYTTQQQPAADDSTAQQYANTTNEIWVDPNVDDVSTLGGGTLPSEFVHFGQDEPTASVNNDYDYHQNRYRTTDAEERTESQFSHADGSNPTTFTNYSKLGLLGQATDFAADDDHSFEEQFAELDNDIRSTHQQHIYDNPQQAQQPNSSIGGTAPNAMNGGTVSNRVKPFEVRAPPGKLGMVVDTPNGGVPVVRAIKPDSVLNGSVRIGDRLISVDHVNVTNMSALEVSNLISLKQHQQRLLIFCRLTQPQQ